MRQRQRCAVKSNYFDHLFMIGLMTYIYYDYHSGVSSALADLRFLEGEG